MNFGEALMWDRITRIIHGYLDHDPPCLGASMRDSFIEPGGAPNAAPPRRWAQRSQGARLQVSACEFINPAEQFGP